MRRLVLRKETLAELDPSDLAAVAGQAALPTIPIRMCYVDASDGGWCESILRPCVSYTCTV